MTMRRLATYTRPVHYTPDELAAFERADRLADIEFAEHQAHHGPYFPERGITRDSLLDYVTKARALLAKIEGSSTRPLKQNRRAP